MGIYLGLISGTSLDAIDAALVDFDVAPLRILATSATPFEPQLKRRISALIDQADRVALDEIGQIDVELGRAFAQARARADAKCENQRRSCQPPSAVTDKRCGTARIWPRRFTWQIGDPNTLAEMTGVSVVADFRRRDVAAGGQGAPLLPVFHDQVFRSDDEDRVIANLGGIANITILTRDTSVTGFDTGPANRLLDAWIAQHLGKDFDAEGAWAASGRVDDTLLRELLDEPYLRLPPPKSTGRELFNLPWLENKLGLFSRSPQRRSGDPAAIHCLHARRRGAPICAGSGSVCLRRRCPQPRFAQCHRGVDRAEPRRQHRSARSGSGLCRGRRFCLVCKAHARGTDFERRQRDRRQGCAYLGRRISLRLNKI